MMQALGLLATLATAACFRLAENRIPNSCSTQSGTAGIYPPLILAVTYIGGDKDSLGHRY